MGVSIYIIYGCALIFNEISTKMNQILMGFGDTKLVPSYGTVEADDLQKYFHNSHLDRCVFNLWVAYILSASQIAIYRLIIYYKYIQ